MKRREAALAGAAASITVAILILVGIPLQSFNHTSGQSSETLTVSSESSASTSFGTSETLLSTSNYSSSLGLRLTLRIHNSTVPRNDGISMRISLNNTLAQENLVSPPSNGFILGGYWGPTWNLQPCSLYPVGIELFRGNYSPGNLSQGKPLGLLGPNTLANCPSFPLSTITFAPLSGDIISPVGWLVNKSAVSIEYWGYWTDITRSSNDGVFHSFEPGTYTIEGEDWWGQVSLLHFYVIPNPDPLDCATIASNPSFAEHANFSASAGPLKLERYYPDLRNNDTVVLALTTLGNSMLTVSNPYFNDGGPRIGSYLFSPNSTLPIQTYQYHSPDGILSNPIVVFPDECSLVSIASDSSFAEVPLLFRIGNQTQGFTLNG